MVTQRTLSDTGLERISDSPLNAAIILITANLNYGDYMAEKRKGYINLLQDKIQVLEAQIALADWMNDALLEYAQSDKFQGQEGWGGDCYIHKNDVIHRALLVRQALEGTLCANDYQEVLEGSGTEIA